MIRSPLMNVMTAAAIKAGKALKRDFAEIPSLQVSKKGPGDSSRRPTSAPRTSCSRNSPVRDRAMAS